MPVRKGHQCRDGDPGVGGREQILDVYLLTWHGHHQSVGCPRSIDKLIAQISGIYPPVVKVVSRAAMMVVSCPIARILPVCGQWLAENFLLDERAYRGTADGDQEENDCYASVVFHKLRW